MLVIEGNCETGDARQGWFDIVVQYLVICGCSLLRT